MTVRIEGLEQFVLGQPENARNKKSGLRLPTVGELFPENH
jgi:hypothetical protein